MSPLLRRLLAVLSSLALTAALVAVMIPGRPDLNSATNALVLVVPVVVGVALGGWVAGMVAVAAGFLAYDFFFIRPYDTLATSGVRDWITLAVYVAVMAVVARLVAALQSARLEARRRADHTSHLLEVSDLLIGDRPPGELLETLVQTVRSQFSLNSVAVLLPAHPGMRVAAAAGEPLPPESELERFSLSSGSIPVALQGRDGLRALPLATAERAIGVLVLTGPGLSAADLRLLGTYANHAALAVERAQLRDQAMRSRLLSEIDGWRRALLGSVAHDLRTPLASIKAALSDLADPGLELALEDRRELLLTAEEETDRLTRMVGNLLDVYRIEAGTKRLSLEPAALLELVDEARGSLPARQGPQPLSVQVDPELEVTVDRTLLVRVLVNLLENASRHTPPGTPVEVRGRRRGSWVELSVSDQGPGMSEERLAQVFAPVPEVAKEALERGGVGLAICKTFVEASGGQISAGSRPGGGLRLDILLPAA